MYSKSRQVRRTLLFFFFLSSLLAPCFLFNLLLFNRVGFHPSRIANFPATLNPNPKPASRIAKFPATLNPNPKPVSCSAIIRQREEELNLAKDVRKLYEARLEQTTSFFNDLRAYEKQLIQR